MKISKKSLKAPRVSQLGAFAAQTLARPGQGQVAAVFDRSVYCLMDGNYICVGVDSLGMCPLNVVTSVPEGSAWSAFGFCTGMPVEVDREYMRIGDNFSLKLNGAPVWRPPPSADLYYKKLEIGLAALGEAAAGRIPIDGLGRLMEPVLPADPLADNYLKYATNALNVLKNWLKEALCDPQGNRDPDVHAWQDLLGLGPGLTPSGDDLTGGMMLALRRLGQLSVLRSLATAVAQVMDDRTNPISAAHLKAAMEGMGSEAVHRTMDAVLAGNRGAIPIALKEVEKVGHTSGWDALAGVVIVMRLWLEVNGKRSRSNCH